MSSGKQFDRKHNKGRKQLNRSFNDQNNKKKHNFSDKEELHSNAIPSLSQNEETSIGQQNNDGDNVVTSATHRDCEENASQLLEMSPNICYTCCHCQGHDSQLSGLIREMLLSHQDKDGWMRRLSEMNIIQPGTSELPGSKQLSASAEVFHPSSSTDEIQSSKPSDADSHQESAENSSNLTTANSEVVDEEMNEWAAEVNENWDDNWHQYDEKSVKNEGKSGERNSSEDRQNSNREMPGDTNRGERRQNDNRVMPQDRNRGERRHYNNREMHDDRNRGERRQNDDREMPEPRNRGERRQNDDREMPEPRNRDDRQYGQWQRNYNRERQNDWNGQRDQQGGRGRENMRYKIVTEVDGDLFTAPKEYSLAHCVATDLRMGSGIAVTFRQQFKSVGELFDQKPRVGHICVLEHEGRYIYYLITKRFSNEKPSFEDLVDSVQRMKDHCVKHDVKLLAMPRIGCGLDKLEWRDVKPMIEKTFSDADIKITVYNYNRINEEDEESRKGTKYSKSYIRFVNRKDSLINIETLTALVFLGSEDNDVDDCGKTLDNKFHFLLDYRRSEKKVGEAVRIIKRGEYLFCLVVKKKSSDEFSYKNFEKCMLSLRKHLKKDDFFYVGFQAFRTEDDDPITMEKIISVLKNCLTNSSYEVHICWPKEFENDCKSVLAQEMPNEGDFTPQERRVGFSLMHDFPWRKPYLFTPATIPDVKRRKVVP